MVRGADYSFLVSVKNRTTGQVMNDASIVNGLELVLVSSINNTPLQRYSMDNGIERVEEGVFRVKILAPDTLLLPVSSVARLEGFTLPVRTSVRINLGVVSDNAANNE